MALIVSFQNVTNCDPISDYKVDIWINERHIDGPFLIKHHKRDDGYKPLVASFARTFCNPEWLNAQPTKPLIPKKPRILHNRIRCKICGEVLESRSTHDFQQCECGIFIDGGRDYVRVGGWNGDEDEMNRCIEFLTEYEKEVK